MTLHCSTSRLKLKLWTRSRVHLQICHLATTGQMSISTQKPNARSCTNCLQITMLRMTMRTSDSITRCPSSGGHSNHPLALRVGWSVSEEARKIDFLALLQVYLSIQASMESINKSVRSTSFKNKNNRFLKGLIRSCLILLGNILN